MTLPLSIYQNLGGKVILSTPVLPIAEADFFRLYKSASSGGPFTPVKDYPNVADKTIVAGKVAIIATRSQMGFANNVGFYLKITSFKGVVESAIGLSDLTSVPPEGVETFDAFRETVGQEAQLQGYEPTSQRWTRIHADVDGRLEVAVYPSSSGPGVATEAKQDVQITHLVEIETATEGTRVAVESIDGKVSTEAKQDVQITHLSEIETAVESIDGKVSTEAKQDVQITHLVEIETATEGTRVAVESIDSKLNTLGQKTSAGSVPVVIASDQSRVQVTETFLTSSTPELIPVGLVSTLLPAVPLVSRRRIIIQNRGPTDLFIGLSGAEVFRLGTNGIFDEAVGPGILVTGIRTAGSGNAAVWEFA